MKHVLIIDDDDSHRLMLETVLQDAGWTVSQAEDAESGLALLEHLHVHAVLLDLRMPGMGGLKALKLVQSIRSELPVILLTAYGTVGSAVQAMKAGAHDFLTKPVDIEQLVAVLDKAAQYSDLLEENRNLRKQLDARAADPTAAIAGISPAMRRLREFILQAGPSEANVLILGESGTGKELIAQALHDVSPRASRPMIKVNCAALPGQLLESELFGYQKGAFTGATRDKPGRFQLAYGGTIFLDEIGDMPVELQAKLLRTLQERIVEPLGSIRPVPVDVRIIAATNQDLRKSVEAGSFREDLYFRLNVLELVSPPLRDRMEDLPVLASRLLDKLRRKNNRSEVSVSPRFLEALSRYFWPGNVRELENILERALILCQTQTLTPETLPSYILECAPPLPSSPEKYSPDKRSWSKSTPDMPDKDAFAKGFANSETPFSLEEAECLALQNALEANEGHRERTARALGISRRTLQYKLKKFGMLSKEAINPPHEAAPASRPTA